MAKNKSLWVARDQWGTYVYTEKPKFAFDGTLIYVDMLMQLTGDNVPDIEVGQCVEYVPKEEPKYENHGYFNRGRCCDDGNF